MKKLLLCTTVALTGLALATPAHADGIKLDLAGHFKGYVTWMNQDTMTGVNERHLDILRETEIHFTGETTLDNGLTVGVHHEADIDSQGLTSPAPGAASTSVKKTAPTTCWKSPLPLPTKTSTACVSTSTRSISV
jgi:hypothetical protein